MRLIDITALSIGLWATTTSHRLIPGITLPLRYVNDVFQLRIYPPLHLGLTFFPVSLCAGSLSLPISIALDISPVNWIPPRGGRGVGVGGKCSLVASLDRFVVNLSKVELTSVWFMALGLWWNWYVSWLVVVRPLSPLLPSPHHRYCFLGSIIGCRCPPRGAINSSLSLLWWNWCGNSWFHWGGVRRGGWGRESDGDVSGACALKEVHNFMLLQSWGEHWRVGW